MLLHGLFLLRVRAVRGVCGRGGVRGVSCSPKTMYISTKQKTTAFLTSAFGFLNASNKGGKTCGRIANSCSCVKRGTSFD